MTELDHTQIPRARVLTDADMLELAKLMQSQHPCRFDNVSCEDMDFIKDLLAIYKETRSEAIKWVVRGVVYGMLILMTIGAYIKWGHK